MLIDLILIFALLTRGRTLSQAGTDSRAVLGGRVGGMEVVEGKGCRDWGGTWAEWVGMGCRCRPTVGKRASEAAAREAAAIEEA